MNETITTTEPLVGRPLPDAAREVAAAAAEWREVGERINGLLARLERLVDSVGLTTVRTGNWQIHACPREAARIDELLASPGDEP